MLDAGPANRVAEPSPTSHYEDDAGTFAALEIAAPPVPPYAPPSANPTSFLPPNVQQSGMSGLLKYSPLGIAMNVLNGMQQPQRSYYPAPQQNQPRPQQPPAFPMNQSHAPGTILMREDGGDLIGWEQLPFPQNQKRMAEFVFHLGQKIQAPEPLWTSYPNNQFMLAFFYAAKEQNRRVRDFEPGVGTIYFIENRWYIHAPEKLDRQSQEYVAALLVKRALDTGRKRLTRFPKNFSAEMKLLVWKECQKQNLIVDEFDPPVGWKRECGLPDDYVQPGMIIGKRMVGWERMAHKDRHSALKYYLESRQRTEGGTVALNDGNDLFRNSALVLGHALSIPVHGHSLAPGAVYAFNDQLFVNDVDTLATEALQAAAKNIVFWNKIYFGDFIDVGGKKEPYKQAVWLAAQEQKVACGYFNELRRWVYYDPGPKFSKAHGFDKNYKQPGTSEDGVLYGFEKIPRSQLEFAIKNHVQDIKQKFGHVVKLNGGSEAYIEAVVREGLRQDVEFFGHSPQVRIMNGKIVCRGFDEYNRETRKEIVKEGFRMASEELKLAFVPIVVNPTSDQFTKAMIKEGKKQNKQVTPYPA